MTSDPPSGPVDGPSTDSDPGESHTGEGLASVRPRLARTLADSALRTADRQQLQEDIPPPNEKSPAATQRG